MTDKVLIWPPLERKLRKSKKNQEPQPYTHTGVTCPCCGQSDAVINITHELKWDSTTNYRHRVFLSHPFCGYEENLVSLIENIFHKHHASRTTIGEIYLRQLDLSIGEDNTENLMNAIAEVNSLTNGFFLRTSLNQDDQPSKSVCPLCGETNFLGDGWRLHCKNEDQHYTIPARSWLLTYLKEQGYTVYDSREDGETYFNVTLHHEQELLWGFLPVLNSEHTFPVAGIVCRLNGDDERVLVVHSTAEVADHYTVFTNLLQENVGHLFKVILKVESK
jgi:hypothetical protein